MNRLFESGNYVVYYQILNNEAIATIGQITQKYEHLDSKWPRDVICGFKPLKTLVKSIYEDNVWQISTTIKPLNFHLWDEQVKNLKDEAYRFSWDILWSIKYVDDHVSTKYFESDIMKIVSSKIQQEKGEWRNGLIAAIEKTISSINNQLSGLSPETAKEDNFLYFRTRDKVLNLKELVASLK